MPTNHPTGIAGAMSHGGGVQPDPLTAYYVRLHKLHTEAVNLRMRLRQIVAERKIINAECDRMEGITNG